MITTIDGYSKHETRQDTSLVNDSRCSVQGIADLAEVIQDENQKKKEEIHGAGE